MKRLAIAALAVLALGAVIAGAQVVTNPAIPPNTVCAYNTSPPTLTNGQASWLQCDSAGNIKTTASGGGGGGAATIADGADVAEGATTDAAATAGSIGTISAKLRFITTQLAAISADPCTQKTKTNAAFSTSSGGPVSIVALSGSTVVYICSISAITDTAIKLSFIDGTGGSCASAQHAIWGSTTAANGMSLPATGGFTVGSGNGTVGVTAAASAFCLLQSGTSLVAGNITYVQQ